MTVQPMKQPELPTAPLLLYGPESQDVDTDKEKQLHDERAQIWKDREAICSI